MDLKDIQAALASGRNLALLRGSKVFCIERIDMTRPKNCVMIRNLDSWKSYIDSPDSVLAVIGTVDVDALAAARGGGAAPGRQGLPLTLANGHTIQPGERVLLKDNKVATLIGWVPSRPKFPIEIRMEDGREMRATAGFVIGREGDPAPLCAALPPSPNRFQGMAADQLLREAAKVYSRLEPEALACDGERSRAQVEQRRRALNAELAQIERAMGRPISEEEAWASLG